jgi:hypothetical protein
MAKSATATIKSPVRARSDGRRTLLVYMDSELIKNIKKVALDEERSVYEIVEEATRDWLNRVDASRARSGVKKSNERNFR